MDKKLLKYFKQDDLGASAWVGKYALETEETPDDMHIRLATQYALAEWNNRNTEITKKDLNLSKFGQGLLQRLKAGTLNQMEKEIYNLFKDFKYIVPQGSVMSMLGNPKIGSLSNCFVVGQPEDSYGGILLKDQELVQLMKRRGGVGLDISSLRPALAPVNNAAKTSTGAISFMHRFSNSTREVAQDGRRGALMLTIDVRHPDVLDFINIKKDRTKVTGANISVMLRDDFMEAVEKDDLYTLRWPCDASIKDAKVTKEIKAREIFNAIVGNAWENAEPGQMFVDKHHGYSPDGVYIQYKGVTTNPCFHPDTLIETEYGRMKIKDITKPIRVYSMDSDGRLVMSNASASFISKRDANTLKITLKSGSSIQVTPEHKLYVEGFGWVKAQDLKVGQPLGHLCRSRRGAKYAGVHLTTSPNRQKDQVMEHKLVYGLHEADFNVHHIDRNTYNNSIENLELLPHNMHSVITAYEDNPQTHQERGSSGKFISGENSKHGRKTIVDLPVELKTNMLSRHHNRIISIEEGETTDVYDIQVEDTHCVIANNIVAHNCGEIFMQAYDACRLMALNLFSFVKNPFTKKAEIDYKLLYEMSYIQQRLADDLVDLELTHIDRILDKLKQDKESAETKKIEINLWENIRRVAKSSRRTGSGFTALGDMLAALGVGYDSDEGKQIIEKVMRTKMLGELDCTIDLAQLRGPFEGWDPSLEFDIIPDNGIEGGKNSFYQMLVEEFPEQAAKMSIYGRRNVSWSTVAPTGTVSLMTQTTSGLEPLFSPYYIRKKKINPNDSESRVDSVDQNGDKWQHYPVLHPKFKDWINHMSMFGDMIEENWTEDMLKEAFEASPWYGSTANDINWIERVNIQAIIQKYTTHSISSTINLPSTVTQDEVAEIYLAAYNAGLKGVTVYRDGSRTGVLVHKEEKFTQMDAYKRPDKVKCHIHHLVAKGKRWTVVVGLLEDKPYEMFAIPGTVASGYSEGNLEKLGGGQYQLEYNEEKFIPDIASNMTDEEAVITRFISLSLRHRVKPQFIAEQARKAEGDITSFSKAIARVLDKYVTEEELLSRAACQDCKSTNLRMEEGCLKCLDCGSSKCG